MKIGKHTLIIDGNYFVHSRLFVLPRANGEQLLESREGQEQFMRKLCIDFASEVRKMTPFIDQIVVAVDSNHGVRIYSLMQNTKVHVLPIVL
jgi:hypothetical protein